LSPSISPLNLQLHEDTLVLETIAAIEPMASLLKKGSRMIHSTSQTAMLSA
jgi:hypothetical protein